VELISLSLPGTKKQEFMNMYEKAINEATKKVILQGLAETKNNKTKAAILLGFDRKTIYNKMKALGMIDTDASVK
jgi:DNA-binding NtrC family response regulator